MSIMIGSGFSEGIIYTSIVGVPTQYCKRLEKNLDPNLEGVAPGHAEATPTHAGQPYLMPPALRQYQARARSGGCIGNTCTGSATS
ncbi:MAG TPA: hypothetical protein VIK92_05385, partial [Thermaerobacter sp.]